MLLHISVIREIMKLKICLLTQQKLLCNGVLAGEVENSLHGCEIANAFSVI